MKKLLLLSVYLALVSLLISTMALLNGCGSNPTGDGNGGPPFTISGALYGGTEEGKAWVVWSTSETFIPMNTAEAEMGHNSYSISGLPAGTYYVGAWQDLYDDYGGLPTPGSLLGYYNTVWGAPTSIVVNGNTTRNITLGCITGLSSDTATSYYIQGDITGGTTEAYILVGISTVGGSFESFVSGVFSGYALKKPTDLDHSGTYNFTGVTNGTYYIGAVQDVDWTWGASMEALTPWWGTDIITVEVSGGNQTGKDLTLGEIF